MTDPVLVKRVSERLKVVSGATPQGDGFWPTLAQVAADEVVRTIVIDERASLPGQRFLATIDNLPGLILVIASGPTELGMRQAATTYLNEHGAGVVSILEVKGLMRIAP